MMIADCRRRVVDLIAMSRCMENRRCCGFLAEKVCGDEVEDVSFFESLVNIILRRPLSGAINAVHHWELINCQ